jgi:hypothetical protein
MIRLLAMLALLALPGLAPAQGLDAQYDVSVAGVNGGTIGIRGRDGADSYAISAAARSTGLLASFVSYGFEGQAQGLIRNGRHVSRTYVEREDDEGEITGSTTTFRGDRVAGVTFDPPRPPRPYDLEPAKQSGVIDPLTALYLALRPVAASEACGRSWEVFDGRHVARLTIGPGTARGDGLRCEGEYRRLRGYSAEEMAERPLVPLRFDFEPAGEGRVQVREISSPAPIGRVVMRRR